jgi:hypothetical protein
LLSFAVLAGCVTDGSMPLTQAVAPGQATLSIMRSDDFLYMAMPVSVELNGAKIASIGKGETYTGGVAAGPAVVTVSCAWASPGVASYQFTAVPGKTYRFTVSPRSANFAASIAGGVLGQAIEGGGPFQIVPAS